jgi:hypothetical protein
MAMLRSGIRTRSASRICAIVSASISEPVMTMRYEMNCEAMVPPQSALVQALAGQIYRLRISAKLLRRLVVALDAGAWICSKLTSASGTML